MDQCSDMVASIIMREPSLRWPCWWRCTNLSMVRTVHAVVEELSTEDTEDPFLREAGIKIWKRRNTYSLISNLRNIWSVPLLHACFLEDQPCGFVTGPVDVREERSNVEQVKTVYNCLGRRGLYFLVNATAFSVPTGVGLGCC